MKKDETVASRDFGDEETNNSVDEKVSQDYTMTKRKYVAVRGYTKRDGYTTVRVRPYVRRNPPKKK